MNFFRIMGQLYQLLPKSKITIGLFLYTRGIFLIFCLCLSFNNPFYIVFKVYMKMTRKSKMQHIHFILY